MSFSSKITSAVCNNPLTAFGPSDPGNAYGMLASKLKPNPIKVGTVSQFNVGLYSALVYSEGLSYTCNIGVQNACHCFGYSDANLLRDGDEVIFIVTDERGKLGIILARKPTIYSIDSKHQPKVQSRTNLERRTHFFKESQDCYRYKALPYTITLPNPHDPSTRAYTSVRPTDLVPGEFGLINQHRCGILGGMFSTTLVGGGAQIRLFSLENKIRIVAENIYKCTFLGNDQEWHNHRCLSRERSVCLYQEERLGMKSKKAKWTEKADYHEDGYFTKNKAPWPKKQTARRRQLLQEGYFGNLSARYCLRPDPDSPEPRKMDDMPKDPGVMRESIDPSGQYRLATTGMLGFERIGRIPVPIRYQYPWQQEVKEPKQSKLEEFQHDEAHPYYRQLELADRVAYDLKNSYSRIDEAEDEFYIPEESDLKDKLKDIYDPGFTESKTVKLEKYDKRRSGIWQGEDGSIILRDAWGSEIVMIGGNIQFSCAGNIETLPGKTALTLAGDDIVLKAQNSIDVESADKDVRINGYNNVQILAGIPGEHTGGVTIEASESAFPWDAETPEGGEAVVSAGILLKAKEGNIATDAKYVVLRARSLMSILSGEEGLGDGTIFMSALNGIFANSDTVIASSENASMIVSGGFAGLGGESALVEGSDGAMIMNAGQVPILWAGDMEGGIFSKIGSSMYAQLTDEEVVALGYKLEQLDKMYFKFRSSAECGTDRPWELGGTGDFTLYEPFWHQVKDKFDTLKEARGTKEFDDHKDDWNGSDAKNPWPGTDAISSGKYAKLSDGPANLDSDGMNKARSEVQNKSDVSEEALFPGYQIRK